MWEPVACGAARCRQRPRPLFGFGTQGTRGGWADVAAAHRGGALSLPDCPTKPTPTRICGADRRHGPKISHTTTCRAGAGIGRPRGRRAGAAPGGRRRRPAAPLPARIGRRAPRGRRGRQRHIGLPALAQRAGADVAGRAVPAPAVAELHRGLPDLRRAEAPERAGTLGHADGGAVGHHQAHAKKDGEEGGRAAGAGRARCPVACHRGRRRGRRGHLGVLLRRCSWKCLGAPPAGPAGPLRRPPAARGPILQHRQHLQPRALHHRRPRPRQLAHRQSRAAPRPSLHGAAHGLGAHSPPAVGPHRRAVPRRVLLAPRAGPGLRQRRRADRRHHGARRHARLRHPRAARRRRPRPGRGPQRPRGAVRPRDGPPRAAVARADDRRCADVHPPGQLAADHRRDGGGQDERAAPAPLRLGVLPPPLERRRRAHLAGRRLPQRRRRRADLLRLGPPRPVGLRLPARRHPHPRGRGPRARGRHCQGQPRHRHLLPQRPGQVGPAEPVPPAPAGFHPLPLLVDPGLGVPLGARAARGRGRGASVVLVRRLQARAGAERVVGRRVQVPPRARLLLLVRDGGGAPPSGAGEKVHGGVGGGGGSPLGAGRRRGGARGRVPEEQDCGAGVDGGGVAELPAGRAVADALFAAGPLVPGLRFLVHRGRRLALHADHVPRPPPLLPLPPRRRSRDLDRTDSRGGAGPCRLAARGGGRRKAVDRPPAGAVAWLGDPGEGAGAQQVVGRGGGGAVAGGRRDDRLGGLRRGVLLFHLLHGPSETSLLANVHYLLAGLPGPRLLLSLAVVFRDHVHSNQHRQPSSHVNSLSRLRNPRGQQGAVP